MAVNFRWLPIWLGDLESGRFSSLISEAYPLRRGCPTEKHQSDSGESQIGVIVVGAG